MQALTKAASVLAWLLCAAIIAGSPHAQAQTASASYPNKPMRMLIPSPPGGGTDTLGRILREGLADLWKQPIVVENRGGASGRIAAAATAKSPPDGYTLLFTYGNVLTTGLPLFRNLPYDPMKDFAPVAMMAHVPGILVAHPSFPAKTVRELIKMAKANPGGLNHGTSSIGSSSHLNMALFKQMAGISMLQVSYPGDSPALIALLGGHVPFAFNNAVVVLPHLQSGRLRPIAVATPQRIAQLPEIPTIAESGLPGYEGLLYYLLVAPAQTPQDIIKKLNDGVRQVKQNTEVAQQIARVGAVPFDMTPPEIAATLQRDLDKWTKVIQSSGIQPE